MLPESVTCVTLVEQAISVKKQQLPISFDCVWMPLTDEKAHRIAFTVLPSQVGEQVNTVRWLSAVKDNEREVVVVSRFSFNSYLKTSDYSPVVPFKSMQTNMSDLKGHYVILGKKFKL